MGDVVTRRPLPTIRLISFLTGKKLSITIKNYYSDNLQTTDEVIF